MKRKIIKRDNRAKRFYEIFKRVKIMRSAAAVSYYLTLSFFPFLICLHFFIVSAGIEFSYFDVLEKLAVLPKPAVLGITAYIDYISKLQSPTLLFFAITILAMSLSAAVRTFSLSMEEIRGEEHFTGAARVIFSFVFSFLLLAVTYLFMVFCVAAKTIFNLADQKLGTRLYCITKFEWLPQIFLFLFLNLLLAAVYRGFSFRKQNLQCRDKLFFCSGCISALLVTLSIIFSEIMEISIKYPLVYGSLSFIIIIMIWMYLCAVIILGGSVLLKVLCENECRKKSYLYNRKHKI